MKFYYYVVYQATFTFINEDEDLAGDVVTGASEVVLNDPIKSINDVYNIKDVIKKKIMEDQELIDDEQDTQLEEVVIMSWQLLRMEEYTII